ncbi:MAG: hypothetical protein EBT07_08060 [Actinobacteria bacterium]|nr:hypothetical protein [Actinomycetota bacterium]
MAITLSESLGFNASEGKNRWRVKIIQSGWGSSGYYSEALLSQYGPTVFKSGTKVFMNHPDESSRPERDVQKLAGKLISDATFSEGALYADIEFYSTYAPIIREMAGDIGLSIHAFGDAQLGEAEGRQGPIIESLIEDPLTSVDVVTVAGAGGKFLNLLESYSRESLVEISESLSEGNGMSITKEEFDAAIADLKNAFVEALSPVVESVSVLVESAKPVEVEGDVADEAPALDPVDIAEKFNESGLPKIALQRISESIKSDSNVKSLDELIADEKAYADSLREALIPVSEEVGVVHESVAKSNNLLDEFASIASRISGK